MNWAMLGLLGLGLVALLPAPLPAAGPLRAPLAPVAALPATAAAAVSLEAAVLRPWTSIPDPHWRQHWRCCLPLPALQDPLVFAADRRDCSRCCFFSCVCRVSCFCCCCFCGYCRCFGSRVFRACGAVGGWCFVGDWGGF